MDRMKLLSAALVTLLVVWGAGAVVEVFATTLSIGPNVTAAAATLSFVAVAVLVAIAVGARSRGWLENPESYW